MVLILIAVDLISDLFSYFNVNFSLFSSYTLLIKVFIFNEAMFLDVDSV